MTKQDSNSTATQEINTKTHMSEKVHSNSKHILLSTKVWAAFMTVFIAGIVIGAMSIQLFINSKAKRHKPPGYMKMRILSHITNELNLSPEQRTDAEEIMTQMTNKITAIHKEQAPRMQAIIQSSFAELEKLLNEDQKIKFQEIQKRVQACRRGGCGPQRRSEFNKMNGPKRRGGRMMHHQSPQEKFNKINQNN